MIKEKRKGARTKKDIPENILLQLNQGKLETANLIEWLAIDRRALLENVLKQYNRIQYLKPVTDHIDNLEKQTVNTIGVAIGTELLNQTMYSKDVDLLLLLSSHPSDMIRSWMTFSVGRNYTLTLEEMFEKTAPFAADRHFNVREEAWTAVRPRLIEHLHESLALLSNWVLNSDENIRRFASEVTRPRGVWCTHIEALKQCPELGLPILEPLRSDTSKYVRDSVGNWLNDASKTQPDFVKSLCKRWEKESDTKETKYIIKKALRTLHKPQKQSE